MKINSWFTLVEILVSITISSIIMLWVSVFIVSGMNNIILQKDILSRWSSGAEIFNNLEKIFQNGVVILKSTWELKIRSAYYTMWDPVYYHIETEKKDYMCKNWDIQELDFLQISNYNPYLIEDSKYTINYIDQNLYDISWNKVLWTNVFSDKFKYWWTGDEIWLNNISGITKYNSYRFIADSGNSRIFYIDNNNKVYPYLWISDGIYAPTGIYYSQEAGALYILNNFWSEIIKVSSNWHSIPNTLEINDKISKNTGTFNKMQIKIKDTKQDDALRFTWPDYELDQIIFDTNFETQQILDELDNIDSVDKQDNVITYTFSKNQLLNKWDDIDIKISNFKWVYLAPVNRSRYIEISFWNGSNKVYETLKYFWTNWDKNILNKDLVEMTKIESDKLSRKGRFWTSINVSPNSLWWYIIDVKDLVNNKWVKINESGWLAWWSWSGWVVDDEDDISGISISRENWNYYNYDLVVKDFIIDKDDDENILNIKIEYYQNYDCIDENNNIVRTVLFKKDLSN